MRLPRKSCKGQSQSHSIADESIRNDRTESSDCMIYISNAFLHYGSGSRKVPVLAGMDMNVERGSIYGILGPSGCGKTTLIHCILGKKSLVSGEVKVSGVPYDSKTLDVPGARVGYMPQELALISELTIKETLEYFGRIFRMSKEKIEARLDFLISLLKLPSKDRLIMNLSGGQQRRVSLAVALFHEPEIIILDEPTVGVDPMLRKCIWSHLLEVTRASNFQTTIVITTHYIEEARQANTVGMMRSGQLLAEGRPDALLVKCHKSTLEDVFLHFCMESEGLELCMKNQQIRGKDMNIKNHAEDNNGYTNNAKIQDKSKELNSKSKQTCRYRHFLSYHIIMALLITNGTRIVRNKGFLITLFILPAFLFSLFHICVGHNPKGMTIAIVNEDSTSVSCKDYTNGCILQVSSFNKVDIKEMANLSCLYLSHLDLDVVSPVFYDNLTEAEQAVRVGLHSGVLHFKKNYTSALYKRYADTIYGDDEDMFEQSNIHASLDMSNQVMEHLIQTQLLKAYQKFTQGLLASCNLEASVASPPIEYKKPIHGAAESTFLEFAIPGTVLTTIYYLSVAFTAMAFVVDKREGVADRSWVAGVRPAEVVIAFLLTYFSIMAVQVTFVMMIMTMVFQDHVEGPVFGCVLLLLLQGVCGMSYGLVISASFDKEYEAIMVAFSSLFCSLYVSGTLWPLEGMPDVFRYFSYVLPNTLACDALRGIMSRGWGLDSVQVYVACLVTVGWIILYLVANVTILRIRR